CNPIVTALEEDEELFRPQKPDTIAKSIAIGNPADGYYVLKNIRESGGYGASATDPEILAAIKLLAEHEGIFTEPAGGTTMACAIKLIQSGRIPKDEPICVCITGNGLKTLEAMDGQFSEAPAIPAKMTDFNQLIQSAEPAPPEPAHV
ncbi:MAG: pyridoxal-phosphate dependent enzyme, partial [Planctomycetota bacterium]